METFNDVCRDKSYYAFAKYDASVINEYGTIVNNMTGAEESFFVGMPIFTYEEEYIGRLCLGSWENLNSTKRDLFGKPVPVIRWFIDGYVGPRQKIKTYWQMLGE